MTASWVTIRNPCMVLLLLLTMSCNARELETSEPTLALLNGRIWTGNPEAPWAEALLVSKDEIVAMGTTEEIEPRVGNARVLDATGKFVTPGFIDAHIHFLDGGFRLASVQLRDADTPEELARRIGAFAETIEPGAWITGGDWDHQLWGGELPRRDWIDSLTPDNPVWVHRLDGHMALANTLALEAAGVTSETEDVEGGTIERDAQGEPAGVLKDNAMELVAAVVPPPSDAMQDRALERAMDYVAARGVTTVHHMGTWDDLAVFRRAREHDRLKTRIYAAVPLDTWQRLEDLVVADGEGDAWLRWNNLKGFVDGSLGSRTAAFHTSYDDRPNDKGFFVNSEGDLYQWISGADRAGLHVSVHAIGDRANDMLLDIFERVAKENGSRDRRFRIEHAQHLTPDAIPRFHQLGVIASVQPYHAIDDGRWAETSIGSERIRTTYAFHSLLEAGAEVAFGSDWFVAPPDPLEGIYAALTRRTLDGANPDGWVPEQKISLEQALTAYTRTGAYASFEETSKGMLAPGFLADFVILDRDLQSIPPEEIRNAAVEATIVGGRIVYEKADGS